MAQQRDTAAKRLIVDAHRQRIEFDGRAVTTNGRWDAAFLHCLAAGRHGSPNRAASVDVVQRALVSFGSRRPLAAAQWGRIIDRLRAALRQLDPTLTLEKRLCHAPRGKTGGPWWWHAGTDLALDCVVVEAPPEDEVGSAHSLAALDPGIALAQRPGGFDTLRLASRFKQAMEAWWKALPEHACELLADGPPWAAESDTLRALRQLRLAELHTGLGQFDAAVALLQSLSDQASPPAVLAPHIAVARWRLAYAQDPLAQHARVGDGLRDALSAYGQRGSPTLDATAWAEHCHLLALCERRTLEHDLPLAQGEDDLSARLEPLLRSAHAALLLFLVVRNYERAQHVCANLAYAHQKLAGWLRGEHWALAVEWHALSFALQASFGGAESSAWV